MNADRNIVELSGRLVNGIKNVEMDDGKKCGVIKLRICGFRSASEATNVEVYIYNNQILEEYSNYLNKWRRVVIRGDLLCSNSIIKVGVKEYYGVMICVDHKELKEII